MPDPAKPSQEVELLSRRDLFLNPDLGLDDLVKALGFSRNEVSWIINNRIYNSPSGDAYGVKELSLNIDRGEFLAIIGKSGSGRNRRSFAGKSGFNMPYGYHTYYCKLEIYFSGISQAPWLNFIEGSGISE